MRIPRQVKSLTAKFHVQASRIIPIKSGVYRLISNDGKQYCLKKMHYSDSRLRWMDKVLGQLRKRGFTTIAWRNPKDITGKPLFAKRNQDGASYILTPWIQGKPPSPTSSKDLRACAKTLAKFHLTGRNIVLPKTGASRLLGKWPSLLQAREALLKKHIHQAKQNGHARPFDRLLQTHGDEILRRSGQSLQMLRRSGYAAFCRKHGTRGVLCHGDSGPKNFVLTRRGTYMIDFETLRIDLRSYDLYRMIRLSCKSGGWKFETARAILDGYRSVSPLERTDYELIKVWLCFPNKAYKLLSRTRGAGISGKREITGRLQKMLAEERGLTYFLHQLDNYAGKERIR